MTLATTKKLSATVFLVFVLVAFWMNPSGSAEVFADFLADTGAFFSSIIDKLATFVKGLAS